MLFARAHFDQDRVMIDALAGEDVPVIKTGRVTEQMPFPDHASVVAGGLEIFRQRRLSAVEPVEHRHAVEMAVFAGEDGRTTRRANRVDDKTIDEPHPFFGDAINTRRLVDLAAVSADGVSRVV